ncbi:hypothetical protein OZX69_06865 [Lactobacillus sp. ESL0731]|uniref:hypothetical protein n=1 Tax=unclassified Lactobacillus TaxID=2620435 RepID=UPI0023F830E6|nr:MULTISPECIES: hypothetical protein [unclassified Lactobacillus]WEV50666.1 hypothetical protein OZX63_06860 [Lactobacillus sp. ESL0700]WEV61796.1 hypothetical protein OZX69_06865 [Lactobacillus sp. ESL0731]
MKLKHTLLIVTALITLGTSSAIAPQPAAATTVKAKKIKSYPKNMRGTWYYYDTYTKKLDKEVFTKKTAKFYVGKKKVGYTKLHAYTKHDPYTNDKAILKKTAHWTYADDTITVNGIIWLNIRGWNQGMGDGEYYNVATFDNNEVLTSASGAKIWVDHHAYRTPELAKALKNKHYQYFSYQK